MLASFPEELLASIVMDWLSWKDFGRLDSAMCNRKARVDLLHLISASQYAFATAWSDNLAPGAHYIMNRGVKSRIVYLHESIQNNPSLRDQFLVHTGSAIQTLHLSIGEVLWRNANGIELLQGLLDGLCDHCKNLIEIHITYKLRSRTLSIDACYVLQAFITVHPSLQSLFLESIEHMPVSLIHAAVAKLQLISLKYCNFAQEASMVSMPFGVHGVTSFTCTDTPLPSQLCVLLTELITIRYMPQITSHYTNLRSATVEWHYTPIDAACSQQICTYWHNVMLLRFKTITPISEEIMLTLIRGLPNITILDTLGRFVENFLGDTYMPYPFPDSTRTNLNRPVQPTTNVSPLHTLCMRCEHATTLEEVVQKCPNLTFLCLIHPQFNYHPFVGFASVETSLNLIANTRVRELHLLGYALSNENIAALQHTPLQVLSIRDAENKLNNEGILGLVTTLPYLNTLNLSYCTGLTYKIVLQILPLCLTLRSFTFRTPEANDTTSTSHCLFRDVLPQLFPHVKVFSIHC